ncbi:ricin-type beta-trefoil lectin domain protein [Streptomyces sp. NPDC005551]|uniref:RICIN domain-containing protein n=1 Tax=Streptomyces sp. NPDC005551 TaxID=3364725 RepID=UPI0036B838BF
MHTHPPRPSHPPRPGPPSGESDEILAARLSNRAEDGTPHPVALLMARHWQSAYDYSVVCLASSANVAPMVAAASFHQVLDELTRGASGAALRPLLLVTVRDTVREWAGNGPISAALPHLRKPAGGRGLRAAKSTPSENRMLAQRAFLSLPGLAQCLLWHTEVEAEPISVPAGLSGLDAGTASAALEQAREQFRAGCVRAHQELAPTKECRFYNRLLDVPIRRGGALLPDVRQHLLECRYCRFAAEQLSHFEAGLGTLLAESVLGWGARRYLESRPGRAGQGARTNAAAPADRDGPLGDGPRGGGRPGGGRGRAAGGGRHRLLPQFTASGRRPPPRGLDAKTVVTGAGIASAAVLVTVLAAAMWSDDGGGADPAASSSATGGPTAATPGQASPSPPAGSSPPDSAGLPTVPRQTRLRNLAADLCLDVRGGKAGTGTGTALAVCSAAWTQQWSYERDGLMRSVAAPELCLDSHADASGLVVLGRCAAESAKRADDVRYDLTAQGELRPRWNGKLAVTPVAPDPKADVVSKVRDGSDDQRWVTDAPPAGPDSLSIAGTATPPARPSTAPPPSADAPEEPDERGTDPSAAPEEAPSESYREDRVVTVGDDPSRAPVLPSPVQVPDVLTGVGL